MPRLILKFRDKNLSVHPLNKGSGLTLGRRQSNDIVIDNLAVSGYHARVDHQPEGFMLKDLDSKNGTFVNNQPVSANLLSDQDNITIGKHTLLVDLTDSIDLEEGGMGNNVAPQAQSSLPEDEAGVQDASHSREAPQPKSDLPTVDILLFLAGGVGEIELAGKKSISIGRNKDADIVVSGLWALFVGGPAAMINKQTGSYILRYTGGLIKPKCNGISIKGTTQLNHEDVISIGPVQMQIQLSERIVP
jgi:predicted component of type VI protein secretion system